MVKVVDTSWRSIDPGQFLQQAKYRRFIRIAVLEATVSDSPSRRFWAFIDRKTSQFFIEEEKDPYLVMVEPEELFTELWNKCEEEGFLSIIIPWEDPPLIHFDHKTSLDESHERYVLWRKEKFGHV